MAAANLTIHSEATNQFEFYYSGHLKVNPGTGRFYPCTESDDILRLLRPCQPSNGQGQPWHYYSTQLKYYRLVFRRN